MRRRAIIVFLLGLTASVAMAAGSASPSEKSDAPGPLAWYDPLPPLPDAPPSKLGKRSRPAAVGFPLRCVPSPDCPGLSDLDTNPRPLFLVDTGPRRGPTIAHGMHLPTIESFSTYDEPTAGWNAAALARLAAPPQS